MKKYFLIRKDNNKVVCINDNKIKYDTKVFKLLQKDITKDQMTKVNNGYRVWNKGSKIELEEPKQKAISIKEIDDAKTIDELKEIIKKLI